jgi:hypothetical protein
LAECAISAFGVEIGQTGESGMLHKREGKEEGHRLLFKTCHISPPLLLRPFR